MRPIIDESSYVVLGHLGQLFLEYTFETSQYYHAFSFVVIIDHTKLDVTLPLFFNSRLLASLARWLAQP